MSYILITDSAECLTLNEVKTFLKLDGNSDYDNILTPKINEVRVLAEKITGRDFLNKTWKLYQDDFIDGLSIKKSKLQSITSIQYYSNDVLLTVDNTQYYFTKDSEYSCLYYKSTFNPSNLDDIKQAVEITFISGYGATANLVPQALKNAMLKHIEAIFEGSCQDNNNKIADFYLPFIVSEKLIDVL